MKQIYVYIHIFIRLFICLQYESHPGQGHEGSAVYPGNTGGEARRGEAGGVGIHPG